MREVQRVANLPEFFGKILLVEGYDMDLAEPADLGRRHLAQQARLPDGGERHVGHEGGDQRTVNLSVLDGWWAEGYDGRRDARTAGLYRPPPTTATTRARPPGRTTLYEILQDESYRCITRAMRSSATRPGG